MTIPAPMLIAAILRKFESAKRESGILPGAKVRSLRREMMAMTFA